ncbi:MAG: hypothetical protein GY814_05210 [Gammaproteobacteria bacterium]|nr:hypothetical protein [Gammaproteobacteria bacterium]
MVGKKTAVITLRIDPEIKKRFLYAADLDHRNISNFVEMVLTRYCDDKGINVPEQTELPMDVLNE